MKLGIALPTHGSTASRDGILYTARQAEMIGLDSVWVLDRLLRPIGPEAAMPDTYRSVYSPLEALSFVAGHTTSIRLGTSVLVAAFHQPVMLARRLVTLDHLSAGRLVVGLGQGYSEAELAAVGLEAGGRDRGKRFEEFLNVIETCWAADPVSFTGKFFTVPESELGPKPIRPSGIPVMAAAMSTRSAARAGRLGIGLNPIMPHAWKDLEGLLVSYRNAAAVAKRDPDSLFIVLRVNGRLYGSTQPGVSTPLVGTPSKVAKDLQMAARLGITEVFFDMARLQVKLDEQLGLIAQLRDRVPTELR